LLSSFTAITNGLGDAVVTFFPGTGTGIVAITAEWGTLTQSASLTIATGTVAVQANPTTINATLMETGEIEVTVLLNGGPVINGAVTLGTNSSQVNLSAIAVSTDAFGKVRVTLTPGYVAENVEVVATWEGITGSAIVNIVEVLP
jgi:hypothetical protein